MVAPPPQKEAVAKLKAAKREQPLAAEVDTIFTSHEVKKGGVPPKRNHIIEDPDLDPLNQ